MDESKFKLETTLNCIYIVYERFKSIQKRRIFVRATFFECSFFPTDINKEKTLKNKTIEFPYNFSKCEMKKE